MEINTTTTTSIILSANDVEEIVRGHLKSKGFEVNSYYPDIKMVYTDHLDTYGTQTFNGVRIIANTKDNKIEL